MLFFITSRIISSIAAFLYPGYASYKTLSQRPASEEDLERWLMYWSVLGFIVGVEYVAEWLISWIPLYYPMKTIFLLYLALPQTRGASFLYTYYLQPFFHSHESQIDAALASLKARVYTFVQERFRALWEQITTAIGQQQQAHLVPAGGVPNTGAPPTLGDPVSGPVQLISTFWRSYGPSIVASGTALLRQTQAAATAATATAAQTGRPLSPPPPIPPTHVRSQTTQSVLERRRELEAELAALPPSTPDVLPMALTNPSTHVGSRSSSDSDLRERTASVGRFEEVDVPSDVEGYELGDHGKDEGSGYESAASRPANTQRGSWFGWGGGQAKGGERAKNE